MPPSASTPRAPPPEREEGEQRDGARWRVRVVTRDNAMALGVFQLLAAKRDEVQTARTYVELLREYWTARAEVERLEAGRLKTPR